MEKKVIKWGLLGLAFILLLALRPCKIISAGERGIVLHFGAVENKVLNEGLHFRIPIYTSIKAIDVKTQKVVADALAYSKDLQPIASKIALNFHLEPNKVNFLWQEIGSDYMNRIIEPAIQESVKAACANFSASELVSERPKVKDEIKAILIARLMPRYIIVDDFSIIDFEFSDVYEKAIEEKQVAQQTALKAENDLTRIKTEAEQRVAQAKAEAEAIKIQAQAITQQGGRDYVQLKAIEKWNGALPTQMVPNATVPFIDLTK